MPCNKSNTKDGLPLEMYHLKIAIYLHGHLDAHVCLRGYSQEFQLLDLQ